jgi:hypothetical protein
VDTSFGNLAFPQAGRAKLIPILPFSAASRAYHHPGHARILPPQVSLSARRPGRTSASTLGMERELRKMSRILVFWRRPNHNARFPAQRALVMLCPVRNPRRSYAVSATWRTLACVSSVGHSLQLSGRLEHFVNCQQSRHFISRQRGKRKTATG